MELYQLADGTWIPVPKPQPLRLVIRSAILNALAYTAGDYAEAAHWLGLAPRVFRYQLAVHGIPGAITSERRIVARKASGLLESQPRVPGGATTRTQQQKARRARAKES